jgi:hypothetical protein
MSSTSVGMRHSCSALTSSSVNVHVSGHLSPFACRMPRWKATRCCILALLSALCLADRASDEAKARPVGALSSPPLPPLTLNAPQATAFLSSGHTSNWAVLARSEIRQSSVERPALVTLHATQRLRRCAPPARGSTTAMSRTRCPCTAQ